MRMRNEQLELFPEISTRLPGDSHFMGGCQTIELIINDHRERHPQGNIDTPIAEAGSMDIAAPRVSSVGLHSEPRRGLDVGRIGGDWGRRDLLHRPAGMVISGLFDHVYKTYP